MPYNFTVEWMAGKENVVADALSRAPYFPPDPEDEELASRLDPTVQAVTIEGIVNGADESYKSLLQHLLDGSPLSQDNSQYHGHIAHMSTNVRRSLLVTVQGQVCGTPCLTCGRALVYDHPCRCL